MKVRMRVWVGTSSTVARRVVVTCPDDVAGAELAAGRLAARLAEALGVAGDSLCVGGRLLEDAEQLGYPPLLDGASVRLVDRVTWRPAARRTATAATEIAVIGGPDAGRTHPLSAGSHTVGRSGADLTIADPTLSRLHLRIDVSPSGLTASDLGSENGTLVDGEAVTAATAVGTGSLLRIGLTTLLIRPARVVPATTAPRGDGTLVLSRSSSPITDPPDVRIEAPQPPEPPARRRVPWVAALLPVPVALLLAWFLGPHLLLFALMSPLMVLGNVISDLFGARRRYAEETRRHAAALERCQVRAASAVLAERLWRETSSPDLAAIARSALTPGTGLWARDLGSPQRIVVRLGRGRVRSRVRWVDERQAQQLAIDDAVVRVDLCALGSLSITGAGAGSVLDALLGQLLVLHSPADLQVLTNRADWSEVPHVRTGPATSLLREAKQVSRGEDVETRVAEAARPWTVLALCGTDLSSADLDLLSAICRTGPACRVLTVVTGTRITAARASLATSQTGPAVLTAHPSQSEHAVSERAVSEHLVAERAGTEHAVAEHAVLQHAVAEPVAAQEIVADGVGAAWVGRVAAALTPLRDSADSGAQLPRSVALAEVLAGTPGRRSGSLQDDPDKAGPEPLDAAGIATRWRSADDGAWVTLGIGAHGQHRFDLATLGPHALVGGTTGSGKSELLRTLVTSLGAAHPPDDLAVVLIDYKGGSAFAGLEALPHIIGVVTDLDPALTQRALTSLRAEVRRRERLFAACGASDINSYRRASRRATSELTHLARLVLVVDEFRALADELPEFVDGLVRLAAVGRSLGIHLVLATQRPAGVVTADMRANLNLRIALRMRDRTDSQDVIGSDAAALLDRSTPGRALIRAGGEPLDTVQTATVEAAGSSPRIAIDLLWSDGTTTRREFPVASRPAPTGVVAAIAGAAIQTARTAPDSPWLPDLAEHLEWSSDHPPTAWARLDEPAHQRQRDLLLDLASMAPTAVAGSVGSGRTTAALTIAAAALASGRQTHVYALADRSGPLADLDSLPCFAGLVDRTDAARIAWFTDRLAVEVRERQARPRAHQLLVIIDGWEVLADACDRLDHGALTDRLLATLREGHALGIRALVTGDRSVLSGRVGRACPQRYLLRPSDDTDLALAGVRRAQAPTHWPEGRMLRVDDGAELQVLLRGPSSVHPGQPADPPWRVVDLPPLLPLSEVPSGARTSSCAGRSLTLGLDGDSGGWWEVGQPGRRRVLIAGSPGSGRTTALATIAIQSARAGREVCVIGDEHSDLARLIASSLGASAPADVDDPSIPRLGPHRPHLQLPHPHRPHLQLPHLHRLGWDQDEDLIALRQTHADLVVVADDIERHLDAPVVPALEQLSDLAERDEGLIAVAGDSAVFGLRPRGLGPTVGRGRVTLVLGAPSPTDGDLAGTRLPRITQVVPGRGWLVADRRVTPVQVAAPDAASRSLSR